MFGIRYMPVWVYTIASHLRKKVNILMDLVDTRNTDPSEIPPADFFFYSALNQDVPANLSLLKDLKRRYPKAYHVMGGPATTSLSMAQRLEVLKDFDGVFIGEGEEEVLPFLETLISKGDSQIIYHAKGRFPIERALPMDFELLSKTYDQYYGGVIEVSRGCPFLCEFCDIRTLPNNNKAHNKPIEVILRDLEQFHQLGITNVLFACDNFIGDPNWAEKLIDAIIEFKKNTGHALKAYTWLTINIANHPRLISKMKEAGFDMFFIGIESFGTKQLLETAKVQNTKFDLPSAIRRIQSYGIVVVAGLIFGFDTDGDETVQEALDGILSSGLISGDPTLLTALAGTPLYKRMHLAGRLREGKVALGGHKYSTNIKYLRPKNQIISDYIYFVKKFNSSGFQITRYKNFLNCLQVESATSNGTKSSGYISPGKILSLILSNRSALTHMMKRLVKFLASPARIGTILYAFYLTLRSTYGSMAHFSFWVFNWSNSLIKYDRISEKDFNIESLEETVKKTHILPEGYLSDYFEPIPHAKIKAQRHFTAQTLKQVLPNE
jgi:radical SAM superfamily enzyme YgiQ (UPF0313 family)